MYKSISKCRICKSAELETVLSLGNQALTGTFPNSPTDKITSGPIDLVMCTAVNGCGLVQLLQSYELNEMYGENYGYQSALNRSMVTHLQGLVRRILNMGILIPGDVIIDIGSNDATTLKSYPEGEYELLGIDPTGAKFSDCYPPDIRLIPDFFSAQACNSMIGDRKAKVITSFSMFYDIEDPVAFAKEISEVLDDEGIWMLEQSYLPTMLRTHSFDTICHEHLEFYGLKQIQWITSAAGLKILDVDFNDTNGGSFAILVAKAESVHQANTDLIEQILAEERALGLDCPQAFADFKSRIEEVKTTLLDFLEEAKATGKRVCGLGASTKGNVLLQYFNIGPSLLTEIGEVNPDKFGKFTPGTGIPLKPEDEVLASNPDYLLVLPWHFRTFFEGADKLKGRQLVFPLPKFEIVQL